MAAREDGTESRTIFWCRFIGVYLPVPPAIALAFMVVFGVPEAYWTSVLLIWMCALVGYWGGRIVDAAYMTSGIIMGSEGDTLSKLVGLNEKQVQLLSRVEKRAN